MTAAWVKLSAQPAVVRPRAGSGREQRQSQAHQMRAAMSQGWRSQRKSRVAVLWARKRMSTSGDGDLAEDEGVQQAERDEQRGGEAEGAGALGEVGQAWPRGGG